ncbi:MAG: site-specific integrase [Lachnospiraceae bacterium]|nr:site-specific integrase [Lachnospiraceae bacterium]
MARHGENIRKRIDGRWEARYQVYDPEKGRKIYRSVYGSTYEEAKKKRADALWAATQTAEKESALVSENISEDGVKSYKRTLFSQAANEWLEKVSDNRRHSTYIKYANVYRIHLEGILGSCPLSDMTDRKLQEKISDHLSKEGLSDSIRKSICCVVNQILEFAGRKYSFHIPPLKPATAKPVRKPVETLVKSEQLRLLASIYDTMDKSKIALLLCLYTGMRLGELCVLKWSDFDFADSTVTVSRTVQRIAVKGQMTKTVLMETDPKSECSKRTIPLTAEILELLEGLRENSAYVFGGDKPLEPRTMQYRFKRILEEAGINCRNFHILRHTFATNCVESGMDVKTLSVILGHSDVKITLNRYVHPTMDSRRKQIGRLPDFYGQIRGQAA